MTEKPIDAIDRMTRTISDLCHDYRNSPDRMAVANNIRYMADILLQFEMELEREIQKYTGEV